MDLETQRDQFIAISLDQNAAISSPVRQSMWQRVAIPGFKAPPQRPGLLVSRIHDEIGVGHNSKSSNSWWIQPRVKQHVLIAATAVCGARAAFRRGTKRITRRTVRLKAQAIGTDHKVASGTESPKEHSKERVKERRGRSGDDPMIVSRKRGLDAVEWIVGLSSGPGAYFAYPTLRDFFYQLATEGQTACMVFGLCGSVPEDLLVFFKSTVGVLFSFLLGQTFLFLITRQDRLFQCVYREIAVLTQLVEEMGIVLPPEYLSRMVRYVRLYLAAVWRNPDTMPVEMVARFLRSDRNAVKEMTQLLLTEARDVRDSRDILETVRELRRAGNERLASLVQPLPTVQFVTLQGLATLTALTPFLTGQPDSSPLSEVLYGILVEVLVFVLLSVKDLSLPTTGLYNIDKEREVFLSALDQALDSLEAKAADELQQQLMATDVNQITGR